MKTNNGTDWVNRSNYGDLEKKNDAATLPLQGTDIKEHCPSRNRKPTPL